MEQSKLKLLNFGTTVYISPWLESKGQEIFWDFNPFRLTEKKVSWRSLTAVKKQMGRSFMACSSVTHENMKFYETWTSDWDSWNSKKRALWHPFFVGMNFEYLYIRSFINFVNFTWSMRGGTREWVVFLGIG